MSRVLDSSHDSSRYFRSCSLLVLSSELTYDLLRCSSYDTSKQSQSRSSVIWNRSVAFFFKKEFLIVKLLTILPEVMC